MFSLVYQLLSWQMQLPAALPAAQQSCAQASQGRNQDTDCLKWVEEGREGQSLSGIAKDFLGMQRAAAILRGRYLLQGLFGNAGDLNVVRVKFKSYCISSWFAMGILLAFQ